MFAQSDSDDSDGKCKLQANILDSAALNDLHEQGFEVISFIQLMITIKCSIKIALKTANRKINKY